MNRRALMLPALALVITLAVGSRSTTAQTEMTIVRIASTPIDVGAEVFYAQALGMFKQAGLDVQIQTIDNGAAIAAAVAGGAADIGQSNVVSLATAYEKKLPFVVLAPAGAYSAAAPTTVLITLANAPYKTAKDLDGRTIATNGILNIAQIAGNAWLDKNGSDFRGVKWVEIPKAVTSAALLSHRIDAAVLAEPALSAALATGNFRILAAPYDAIGKRWQIGAWFSTKDWVASHPDAAKRFVAVMLQAARWANTHQDESLKIISAAAKVNYPKDMHRAVYAEQLEAAMFQPVIDNAAKYGAIAAPFAAANSSLKGAPLHGRLTGHISLVTGASSGIGAGVARALGAEGATVVAVARRYDRLVQLADDITSNGGTAVALELDITNGPHVVQCVREVVKRFGRIDSVVNAAGVMQSARTADAGISDWRHMFETNVLGLMAVTHAAFAVMRTQGSGHVVNISSVSARLANPGSPGYAATKSAVNTFSESLRKEGAGQGIRVTVVSPGIVETELLDHLV